MLGELKSAHGSTYSTYCIAVGRARRPVASLWPPRSRRVRARSGLHARRSQIAVHDV